jgi:uncharacterized membrane protein YkvA (DUF1232 family)
MKSYYDYLKESIQELQDKGEDVDKAVLYLPDFFGLLCALLDKDEVDKNSRMLINSALAYFVSPSDVVPEEVYGAYGYLDDLYLTCVVLKNLDSKYKDLIRKSWEGSAPYDEAIDYAIFKAEKFLDEKNLKDKVLSYAGLGE